MSLKEIEKQLELSQMSEWTQEAKPERPKTAHGRDLSQPKDPYEMSQTIYNL